MPKITAFGEILWDNLPTGKVLGGAPVNLLTHLAALGATELQAELEQSERLTPDLARLLQDFIVLNYASSQAPSQTAAQAWYRRARKLSRKHRLKTEWAA